MRQGATPVPEPVQDAQTVTPTGERVAELIAGVRLRQAVTHPDDRGELCEIYDPRWGFHEAPLVYSYLIGIRPGRIKGWVLHRRQDDRLFLALGTVRIVLFDDRADSPTRGMINELFVSERNRALLTIPAGVFHALQNVGGSDAMLINHPTRPFDHTAPDKYRLPLDTDRIPFRFDDPGGR